MKSVTISKNYREMQRIFQLAQKEDVVVRTPAGDEFIISPVDDFAFEIAQQRQNRKLMAFLDKRFRAARREKGIPLKQVKQELGLKDRSQGSKKPRQHGS